MGFKYFTCDLILSDEAFKNRWNEIYQDVCLRTNSLERIITECESGVSKNSKLLRFKALQQSIKKHHSEITNHCTHEMELRCRASELKLSALQKDIDDGRHKSVELKKKCGTLLDACYSIESEKALLVSETRQKHNAYLNVIRYYSKLLDCKIIPVSENHYEFQFSDSDAVIILKMNKDHLEVAGFQPKLKAETLICQHVKKTQDFQGLISLFHSIFQ